MRINAYAPRRTAEAYRKESSLRIDKFLKNSRLIKRRSVANDACDAKRVSINGKTAKASSEVKIGDIIEIRMGQNEIKVEVLKISEHVMKDDAAAMYDTISRSE